MINIPILITIYFTIGFIYSVILRSRDIIFKNESFFVISFWPVHLIVRTIVFIFDIIDWISIGSTVDFFAKRLPFSKLKD